MVCSYSMLKSLPFSAIPCSYYAELINEQCFQRSQKSLSFYLHGLGQSGTGLTSL